MGVELVYSEEPDEGNLHVRICGGSAGQPVLLPGIALESQFFLKPDLAEGHLLVGQISPIRL